LSEEECYSSANEDERRNDEDTFSDFEQDNVLEKDCESGTDMLSVVQTMYGLAVRNLNI